MKNLFILGSPQKDGNSVTMARVVANELANEEENSIEYIYLNSLSIQACQGCGGCNKTGECVLNDDMQQLYTKTESADRLFLVSPIYFYSLTAQLKSYIDRCQAQWAKKYLLKQRNSTQNSRSGHLLSCAATNGQKLFDGAELIVKCLCDTLDITYGKPLLIRNVEQKDAIKNNTDTIATCSAFSRELLKSVKKAAFEHPGN